ncbi:trehalase family glycosidase [Botrimarina sp.]|uniref:MGH1-like glycoside hydrolase domain-containing protein n=1 Tax=Botrimarina sp. TaxID=2795802 RepID=UPI0032EF7BEA
MANRGFRFSDKLYEVYVYDDLYYQNEFIKMPRDPSPLPTFAESRDLLPDPYWEGNEVAIDCWWKIWELAFQNLRKPTPESGFPANYIDTAFNDAIFMWDSAFILMFGRYGRRAFDFLRTLDNFYAKQHYDGFICREIGQPLGDDRFQRYDPTSTGPNVLGWTEWEYYLNFGDKQRLAKVFPVLTSYHHWLRTYRTWQDGSYYSSGWGCGMDNQPRLPAGLVDKWGQRLHEQFSHGHMTWVDACLQMLLSAKLLQAMAKEVGRESDVGDMRREATFLQEFVNNSLWNEDHQFYCDRFRDGRLSHVKSIGAYWALLADATPPERLGALVAHLENPAEFNRPHRVPTLSAGDPDYQADNGGYWKGAVWPPTNYMVLRGLTQIGNDRLAHEIAINHLRNVHRVFAETGTVWENYAPEAAKPGAARKDFVGWGGLPGTAVLLEYAFGLRPDVPAGKLVWDVRLTDAHGVKKYPFGPNAIVDLQCPRRASTRVEPNVTVRSNESVSVEVLWEGGSKTVAATVV